MREDGQEWTALADHVTAEVPPEDEPESAEDGRLYRKLLRAKPTWKVLERAHAPFRFRANGRVRRFHTKDRQPRIHDFEAFAPPPRSLDWRVLTQLSTPLDQRGCNCCTAFALAATMTDLATIRYHSPRAPLSPGHLHWCIGGVGCADALDPTVLAGRVTQRPVALWQPGDYPYDLAWCPTAQGFGRLASVNVVYSSDQAFQELQSGPILAVMDLYDDFWSHFGGGAIYSHVGGSIIGAHSIEVVGYDLDQCCWFVKNSEGIGWGDGGYASIAFGECRLLTPGGHVGLAVRVA